MPSLSSSFSLFPAGLALAAACVLRGEPVPTAAQTVAAALVVPVVSSAPVAPPSGPALPAPAAPAVLLDRAGLLERLTTDLAAHYSVSEDLTVDLIRPWLPIEAVNEVAVAAPVPALTVRVIDYPEALASSMLVRVRYARGERIPREDTLSLRVSLWRDGMIATSPLKRGDPVSLQLVETRRVDALRDREALPVSAIGEDYIFARAIPAGRPLTWRDVSRRSLVRRGETIEVQASDGALVITMKALAMQDGSQGESVRVRNLESRREFTALVIAENRAEVRF